MKIQAIFEKAKFSKVKKIFYHGTSMDRLKSILINGLQPTSNNLDGFGSGAGGHEEKRDMTSLGGVYLTNSFMYAMDAAMAVAKKRNSQPLYIIVQAEERTAIVDEDDFDYIISNILRRLRNKEVSYPVDSEEAMFYILQQPDHQDKIANDIREVLIIEKGIPTKTVQSIDNKLLIDLLVSYYGRKLAYKVERGNLNWRYPEYEEAFSNKSMNAREYEVYHRNTLNILSKKLKNWIPTKEHSKKFLRSFRINEPIGFKGANKIIGIFSKDDGKTVIHYGKIPESLLKSY